MRDYGSVSPQFWIGKTGKALRGHVAAQLVALYLMTSPHANMIGVYYCPIDTIAKETGLPMEGASEALRSLEEAGYCQFDPSTEEVFVVRMAAFQVGEQLEARDNRCKGIARDVEKIMSDKLRSQFRAIYSGAFHLPAPAQKPPETPAPTQPPSKPLRSQKQEQEQNQEQGHSEPNGSGGKPPKITDPKEIIFGYGLAMLVNAGTPEKHARSFLGGRASEYSDQELVDVLRDCAKAKTLQPLEWIAKAMPPKGGAKPSKHAGLKDIKYAEGVEADGTFT
jgi:hypothetical protein